MTPTKPAWTGGLLHILQHALGVDQYGRGSMYRSHFVTGEGSVDHPLCMEAVERGLMTRRDGRTIPYGGDDLFHVTDAGRAYVRQHSPEPPKLTRSQRRYAAYVSADSSLSFGDWLRTPWAAALSRALPPVEG